MKTSFYLSIAILVLMIIMTVMIIGNTHTMQETRAIDRKIDSLHRLHDTYVDKTDSIQYVLIHDLYERLNKR